MFLIEGEIDIERPVEEVFDFAVDVRNEPRYNPRMRRAELITGGPIEAGARFRAEIATMGRPIAMLTEITAYDRPRRYASSTHMAAMDTSGSVAFEPVHGGTRMRWAWKVEPRGFLRLMGPLAAVIGRRQEKANWMGLRRLLEGKAGDSAS